MLEDGGSSSDRRKFRRLVERIEPSMRTKTSVITSTINSESSEDISVNGDKWKKLVDLWSSTPAWGVIGVIVGTFINQIPVKLVYVLVWAVFSGEFARIRFFEARTKRYIVNALFSMVVAVGLVFVWRVVPKPREQPTLDQQTDAVTDKIAKRFPWLSSKPESAKPLQSSSQIPAPTILPRPWISLEKNGPAQMNTNPYPSITLSELEKNTGDAVAKRIQIVGDLFYGPRGIQTEDTIFRTLQSRTDKSSFDQAPHDFHLVSFGGLGSPKLPDGSFVTPANIDEENHRVFSGIDNIYLASRVVYWDEKGGVHHSEQCMVGGNLEDSMGFCLGHNGKD